MSDIDPDDPRTTEVRTTYDPATATRTEVTRTSGRSNAAAWWVAGIVAVVAIIAVAVMVSQPTTAPTDQLTAAAEQGRAQAMADSANAALAQSQANAAAAQQAAAAGLRSESDRAAQARADAEAAAHRAAASAADAGKNASTTVPDEAAPPPQ